jgi:hypothetical protein
MPPADVEVRIVIISDDAVLFTDLHDFNVVLLAGDCKQSSSLPDTGTPIQRECRYFFCVSCGFVVKSFD